MFMNKKDKTIDFEDIEDFSEYEEYFGIQPKDEDKDGNAKELDFGE